MKCMFLLPDHFQLVVYVWNFDEKQDYLHSEENPNFAGEKTIALSSDQIKVPVQNNQHS